MSDFYLTLPSNSSMQSYPDNTLAQFTTQLPNPIDLKGDWEVGLVEIQYPQNWNNVPKKHSLRTFSMIVTSTENREGPVGRYQFTISEGYYPSIDHLLKEIEMRANTAINRTGNEIVLHYDPITRKVSITPGHLSVLFVPDHVRRMLGMTHPVFDHEHMRAEGVVDMDPVDSLYVYCNVVEHRVVGDSLVPLLRIVPVEGHHGDLVTRIYENIHYVQLQRKSIRTLEIDIRDRTGEKVAFERGTLNVTLHFRQRKRLSTL